MKKRQHSVKGEKIMKKFVVYNEDDESFGKFNTLKEAKNQIKDLKRFDKEQENPFEEVYRIEVEE